MQVLNPALYQRLQRHFGNVKVSAHGEAMRYRSVRGIEDEPKLLIEHAGEYYSVCCPYCNDTRYRLYVNHMFGQTDGHGRRMQFLAICYNEGCLNEPANRRAFIQMLDDPSFAEAVVRRGKIVNPASTETFLPGACTPLHELTDSHLARQYIRSRGYDPDVLGRTYRVSYCAKSHYNLASNRIIIPVYDGDRLRGWQARYIGELPWKGGKKRDLPPKYFSCPGSNFRSQCIFNFDRMSKWTTGIIVEGTTDVFAIGSMAGAIFGNSMTDVQKRRLLAVFAERTVVLLLDPEEFESKLTQRTIRELSAKMPKRFCAVRLPDATDPGSLSREFTKAYVKEEAARQGVKVSYKRVRDGR